MLQPPDEYRLPERPPRIVRTDSATPMSDGLMLGIAVAVIAVVGALFIFGVGTMDHRIREPVFITVIFIAWVAAGFGLLTVWLGIGGGRLYLGLLVVGAIGAITILIVGRGTWSVEAFAYFVLFLAAGALPFGLLYLAGFEFASSEVVRFSAKATMELRRGQVSLGQLFGWTVAAALVASVARFAKLDPRDAMPSAISVATFSSIAVGAVCATLMPGRREMVVLRIIILGASTMLLIGGGAVVLFGMPPDVADLFYLALGSLAHVSLIGFVLLLYRRLGYRLRRRGLPIEISTTGKPSAS
jgi:hypothetical protein